MNDIIWITMRQMRSPLIVLLLVYFLSILVLVFVPGEDARGLPVSMSVLDAAYFVAILSTTIGLGEVPFPFTGAQRFLVLLILFPNVIAWLYSIGAMLRLFVDPRFKAVLERNRFRRQVRWIGEPFYLICGFGQSGSMIARGLIKRGQRVVVVEQDPDVVGRELLHDQFAHMPILTGDSTNRENLELSGLHKDNCCGVIAATNDDHANLTIAITSKLLEPDLPVYARCANQRVSANLDSFGTDQVVDPYEIFAGRLFLALASPEKYLVQDWLIAVPGAPLRKALKPPSGHWVVCGAGRFGSRIISALERAGQHITVIDVHPERIKNYPEGVLGRGTQAATLEEAGISEAVGVVAGTGDDIDNLSILLTAKELNPDLFMVARQEQQQNDALFVASGAQLVAQPTLIVARRVLGVSTTPLLKTFLEHLVHQDKDFANRARHLLHERLGDRAPVIWVNDLSAEAARGVIATCEEGIEPQLDHLLHNTRSGHDEQLRCVCLVLERGAQRFFLPQPEQTLKAGDRLLFAGRSDARDEITRALADPVLLLDYVTPDNMPRTALGRWLKRRQSPR